MLGKFVRLSPTRRLVCDMLNAARSVPTVPVQRRMRLANLVSARAASTLRPSWQAIFTKAFARVAARMPELRRAYIKFPWAHLYEYPVSVASIVVERDFEGEKIVFAGRIHNPAVMPLCDIHRQVRSFQEDPLEQCRDFQRWIRMSRFPWLVRRVLWWIGLNLGRQRGKCFGTFAVSVYSALGAESLHPLSPATTTLNYGVIAPDGTVDVRLVYDHRVLDGATVARALGELEAELLGSICKELASARAWGRVA